MAMATGGKRGGRHAAHLGEVSAEVAVNARALEADEATQVDGRPRVLRDCEREQRWSGASEGGRRGGRATEAASAVYCWDQCPGHVRRSRQRARQRARGSAARHSAVQHVDTHSDRRSRRYQPPQSDSAHASSPLRVGLGRAGAHAWRIWGEGRRAWSCEHATARSAGRRCAMPNAQARSPAQWRARTFVGAVGADGVLGPLDEGHQTLTVLRGRLLVRLVVRDRHTLRHGSAKCRRRRTSDA